MANNPELAFIESAKQLGHLKARGLDSPNEQNVTHSFLTFSEDVAFRRALQEQGFVVSERLNCPGLEARREELLTTATFKSVVEQLCKMADKYAAEYDGWQLTADTNQLDSSN